MDKMREEFEAWVENYYDELWVHLCERTKAALFDCYTDAWQASRQALVVELPPQHEIAYRGYDSVELRYALKDAGIKWTE